MLKSREENGTFTVAKFKYLGMTVKKLKLY
jgi:hypothetical protein